MIAYAEPGEKSENNQLAADDSEEKKRRMQEHEGATARRIVKLGRGKARREGKLWREGGPEDQGRVKGETGFGLSYSPK